ncbi:hypothetical protein Kpol_1018p86 [Vanderwaltozyma polyspora DSM 70294]|uniref:Peptidase M48 domain-containing protein n=1 Tax=Vanderwaltozyma polyspora (strain ATCC 22028 / DSM 70294 / BCRC 21397 / CBS 2163 / NBRC 10782 / NRRL Y-8283 / UCD 57-17) TaxID=436907 RepID=A7TDT3_VANPO|nr:uncharacterized protein Kpol_1018p86 [Vanderwaltozyma polyspora DSM 70294]EDO19553.1 hypothetical protein Kpol_1018p86 [Vanderwaltozyma polyspora DSM 70294]
MWRSVYQARLIPQVSRGLVRSRPVSSRLGLPTLARFYNNGPTYRRFNNSYGGYNGGWSISRILLNRTSRNYLTFFLGGSVVFYVANLEEAPVTGRKRCIWIPRSLELKIGDYSYKSIMRESGRYILPESHPLTKKVENVFSRILEAAYKDPSVDKTLLDGINWQIHVVNDPKGPPNAFVLPGGKVFVYSSILPICKNDDGLATVLSHEFSHQLARHTAENLSKAPIYSMIGIVMYTITGVDVINNLLLDGLLRMPASRQMETEADYIGLMIMARACFNPDESIRLWKRMSEFEKSHHLGANGILEFLSTHPASDTRIQNMHKWLGKAKQIYEESDCSSIRGYYSGLKNSIFGNDKPEFQIVRF